MNPVPDAHPKRNLLPFIAMIRQHWPAMALGGLLSLIATLAAIGLLALSGWFIAATAYAGLNVATAKAFNFFFPSIGVRLFAMTRTAARYGERVISHDATFRILETLRTWCYIRLEPLAPARLAKHHTGDLLSRIITDIDTLDNLFLRVLSPTVVAITVVTLLVGFIGYYHPALAMVSAAFLIVAGVGIPILADQAARPAARRLNVHTARLRTALVDGFQGLAALQAFGAESRHINKLLRRHMDLVHSQKQLSQVTGFTSALMVLLSGLAVVVTLYMGVQAVEAESLSGPHLALLVLAVMAGFDAVIPLSNAYQYLGQTRKAASRLQEVTEEEPAVTFKSHRGPVPVDGHIQFEGVAFQYAGTHRPVLENINLTIKPGQRTAIMGATGAGKSTLLYLLSRFEDPGQGQILLGGSPLQSLSEETLRGHLCVVDQKAHIFNGTLADNLRLANPVADQDALERALSAVCLTEVAKALPDGLETWLGEAGRLLSGGQARRVALARAVLSPARMWALDEPTEGLDSETASAMMDNLLNLDHKRTIVMVTHRSEAVEQMDQVIVMEAGRVAAVDSPANLKGNSALYDQLIQA